MTLLVLSPERLYWLSVSHSGLLRFFRITRLKANLNKLKIHLWVMDILRKLLLMPLRKLSRSLGITSGHLALLNAQFLLHFLRLDLLACWLQFRFLPLLYAVIMWLWFEHLYNSSCIPSNHHHHHDHVVLVAWIFLTLSRHFSLSFIASGRSSGQHPVSSYSCWMYVRAGRPAFARPSVGIHKSTSLMSSYLLLQQCPACLVRLT